VIRTHSVAPVGDAIDLGASRATGEVDGAGAAAAAAASGDHEEADV
jgi:hypothetical protein